MKHTRKTTMFKPIIKNQENERINRYQVKVTYKAICRTAYNVYGATPEEALQTAHKLFEAENQAWIADGGDPKILDSVEIVQ